MAFYNYTPEKNIISEKIVKWVTDIITVMAIAFFLCLYFGDRVNVVGNSMAPVIEDEADVLVDKMTFSIREPKRFDVIVFKSTTDEDKYVVKRIIALPGETIQITDSTIYITDTEGKTYELEDKYCSSEKYESGQAEEGIKIGENEYFVLGDNRNLSEDSRFSYIGNISREDILGKAWLISSPFSSIGLIK